LCCNQCSRSSRYPFLINHNPQPNKNSPLVCAPFGRQNQKGIFYDSSRRLVADYRHLDSRISSSGRMKVWIEKPFFAPKLAVRAPGGKKTYRLLREVLNAPFK
jgi:hypothetical protein